MKTILIWVGWKTKNQKKNMKFKGHLFYKKEKFRMWVE